MYSIIIYAVLLMFNIAKGSEECNILGNSVSDKDAKVIVDTHNAMRQLIVNGTLPGQPRGVNLKIIKYDRKLAVEAQKIANSCEFAHKLVTDNRWAVGQNLYTLYTTSSRKTPPNWRSAIQAWFDEHQIYKYARCCSSHATGHYTQLVWANTEYVGCGYTYYVKGGWYHHLYVCNYGPAGNYMGETPYKIGQ